MATLVPSPKMQFFDANGNPLASGKLYTYAAGTTTPQATYTDSGGGTPNANPVILDSRGEASVWLSTSLYKFVLKTSADVQIWSADNVGGQATLSALAASSGSSLIGFIQSGAGAVARILEDKERERLTIFDNMTAAEIADVRSGTASIDVTAKIQSVVDYALANNKNISPVDGGVALVSQIRVKRSASSTTKLTIDLGVALKGSGASTPLVIGGFALDVANPVVWNANGATYAAQIDGMWWSSITGLYCYSAYNTLSPVLIKGVNTGASDAPYSYSWNTNSDWTVGIIYLDVTDVYATENNWNGGRCYGIVTTAPDPAVDMYGNVFSGFDIVGAVTNAHTRHALILNDCTYEGSFTVSGLVERRGGRDAYDSGGLFFDQANLGNIYEPDGFANDHNQVAAPMGYRPTIPENLVAHGDLSFYNVALFAATTLNVVNTGSTATGIRIVQDTTSPLPSKNVLKIQQIGAGTPLVSMAFPLSHLDEAKKIGWASFAFWIKPVTGFANVRTSINGGASSAISNFNPTTSDWNLCIGTIKVTGATTSMDVQVTTNNSDKEIYLTGIAWRVGKECIPYTKPSGEPLLANGGVHQFTAAGATQSLFSFDMATAISGSTARVIRFRVKAWCVDGSTQESYAEREFVAVRRSDGTCACTDGTQTLVAVGTNGIVNALTSGVAGTVVTISGTRAAAGTASILMYWGVEWLETAIRGAVTTVTPL